MGKKERRVRGRKGWEQSWESGGRRSPWAQAQLCLWSPGGRSEVTTGENTEPNSLWQGGHRRLPQQLRPAPAAAGEPQGLCYCRAQHPTEPRGLQLLPLLPQGQRKPSPTQRRAGLGSSDPSAHPGSPQNPREFSTAGNGSCSSALKFAFFVPSLRSQ